MTIIKLPYGNDFIKFNLPKNWELLGVYEPQEFPAVKNVKKEFIKSVKNPEGTKLEELCRNKNKIVIVVDDISRPTPAYLFLEDLLKLLNSYNVKFSQITIVTAAGIHKEMTKDEIIKKIGEFAYKNIKCVNHNCRKKSNLKYLGKTKRGTTVFINKIVADTDLIILIGTIEPHIQAGFGGGLKNILPGVAGKITIAKNHLLSAEKDFSKVGNNPENTPMRLDLEEAAFMLKKNFFIINTVLNHKQEVIKFFCGDPILAHREGIKFAKKIHQVKIKKQADIVITTSHPFDINLSQGVKGIVNPLMAAKKNGLVIGLLRCEAGIGDVDLSKISFNVPKIFFNRFIIKNVASALSLAIKKLPLKKIPVEMKFFLYIAMQAVARNSLFICAPALPEEFKNYYPYFFTSFKETLKTAKKLYPKKATVNIFNKGGITYPQRLKD